MGALRDWKVPASFPPRLRRIARAAPAALLIYVLAFYAGTALLQRGLFERDGYYHARLAQMVAERGFSRSFPWTQVSTWKDGYCDKEVLYHVAMAPFAEIGDQPITGARIFGALLSASVVAILLWLMRAHAVPWPTWFAALPLATGALFLARLGMIRSHVLSMALLLIGVHFLLQRRWRAVGVLGFVYAWSYTVPFVLVLTAAPLALGRWLGRGGLDWRSVAAAGLGATVGLVIHPYSPLTLETFFTYIQIFGMGMTGVNQSGFELGNEIYPYSLAVFFDIYPLLVMLLPVVVLTVALRWRRVAAETKGVVLATLLWAAMTALSARFVEYLALLLAVSAGLVVRDLARSPDGGLPRWVPRGRRWRALGAAAALALLVGFHVRSLDYYSSYESVSSPPRFFDGAGAWMASHLAPGETVINLWWDDFPDLFYSAPRQHYLWGLDPTYSVRFDEQKARQLERARRQVDRLDGPALTRAFDSYFLVLRAARVGRYDELKRPPFHAVYRDNLAEIYRIDDPQMTTSEAPEAKPSLDKSLALYQQGKFEESITAAREALKSLPEYAEAWNNIGAAYNSMSRWDEAIGACQEAIRLKPDFALAKNNLAWAVSQKKKTAAPTSP